MNKLWKYYLHKSLDKKNEITTKLFAYHMGLSIYIYINFFQLMAYYLICAKLSQAPTLSYCQMDPRSKFQ